jgi:CxxC motif-containing protein (DUF1111 family)
LKSACPADPNDDGKLVVKINFYLETLAPPPRATTTLEANRGEHVFQKMGCALCHVAKLQTGSKVFVINPDEPTLATEELAAAAKGAPGQLRLVSQPNYIELRALENKQVHAYSDFLVHDMGPVLDDSIAQQGSTSAEWRTAPLWGLRLRKHYLHDGRARTLQEAISLHGGQAASSQKAFRQLSPAEKDSLIAFLNSL